MWPAPDASEEVALVVAREVTGLDLDDAPIVNISSGNKVRGGEVPEPPGGVGIILVVVRTHASLISDQFPLTALTLASTLMGMVIHFQYSGSSTAAIR